MRTLPIEADGHPVRNLYQEAPEARGNALLLPGAYYASQAPGLYYAREVLNRARWNTLAIDYRYFLAGEPFSEAKRAEAAAEAESAYRYLVEQTPQADLLIVGKSLGSILALHLALRRRRGTPTALMLLTPIENRIAAMLGTPAPEEAERAAEPWALFAVRCGADDARDDAAWGRITPHFAQCEEMTLGLTTHGLDSLNGPEVSLAGLTAMCARVEAWLAGL